MVLGIIQWHSKTQYNGEQKAGHKIVYQWFWFYTNRNSIYLYTCTEECLKGNNANIFSLDMFRGK